MQHTEATKEILDSLNGSRSEFIREAILKFAKGRGFEQANPDLVSDKNKLKIEALKLSNKRMKRKINYSYIYAFWWLKLQPEFRYISLSELQRLIICQSSLLQISSPLWRCDICNAVHEGKKVHCDNCDVYYSADGKVRMR